MFPTHEEKTYKIISIITSLNNTNYSNELLYLSSTNKTTFNKTPLTQYVFELIKNDAANIKRGLIEKLEKKKRNLEKEEKIKANFNNFQKIIDEYTQAEETMLKTSVFNDSCKTLPIELHFNIMKNCFDCKLIKEFEFLADCINTRISLRQIETPFLCDIDIQVSPLEYGNVPNKYEKIHLDLNINSYNEKIKALRDEGKYISTNGFNDNNESNNKENKDNKDKKKDIKKNEKDILQKNEALSQLNNYNMIENLNHMFVYLLLRKTTNPSKAIISMRVVFSNDEKIDKEILPDERAVCIPIQTYENNVFNPQERYKLKTTYGDYSLNTNNDNNSSKTNSNAVDNYKNLADNSQLFPYIIYKKTNNSLQNEEERLSAYVDIYPLISNSEFSDAIVLNKAILNYKKDETELTNKAKSKSHYDFHHNYINILTKTDEEFYLIERESKIFQSYHSLEISYTGKYESDNDMTHEKKTNIIVPKISNYLDPNNQFNYYSTKTPEDFLGIKFNLSHLHELSIVVFESIQGPLGVYFLTNKPNLLNNLIEILYKKYLHDVFLRIDYFFEMENEFVFSKESKAILDFILLNQNVIFDICYKLQSVYVKLPIKIIEIYTMINITNRLADFSERTENFIQGCEATQKCIMAVNEFMEESNVVSLNNQVNRHPYNTFSCNNNKTIELINYSIEKIPKIIEEKNFKRRRNFRSREGVAQLKDERAIEEQFEAISLEEEYEKRIIEFQKGLIKANNIESNNTAKVNKDIKENKDNKDLNNLNKDYNDILTFNNSSSINNMIKAFPLNLIGENELTIYSLLVEIHHKFFRLYLKLGMKGKMDKSIFILQSQQANSKSTTSNNNYDRKSARNTLTSLKKTKQNNKSNQHFKRTLSENNNLNDNLSQISRISEISKKQSAFYSNSNLTKNEDSNNVSQRHLRVPDRLAKKPEIIKGESSLKTKENLQILKKSLQDAGKLDPDKPKTTQSEIDLMAFTNKNSYLNALLKAVFAYMKASYQDQKFLLQESLKELNNAFDYEEERSSYYKKYCFEIYASQYSNMLKETNWSTVYPFSLLTKPLMLDVSDKLPEPIIIHKTATTVTLYTPICKLKTHDESLVPKITYNTAIYGQISTGTNIVKLHCNKLSGSGKIDKATNLTTITNLKINEKYIFGYAGYDTDEVIINDVGETTKEINAYLPLPLYLISSKIILIAFELKHYYIVKDIGKRIFSDFTELTNIKSYDLDNKTNSLFSVRLRLSKINRLSLIEQEGIAKSFLYFAKSILLLNINQHTTKISVFDDNYSNIKHSKNNPIINLKQKNLLKNINIITQALKIAINIRNFPLIKEINCELINSIINLSTSGYPSTEFFSSSFIEFASNQLNQILLLMHIGLLIIPNELVDCDYRKILAKVLYLLFISYSFNNNSHSEADITKKVLIQDLSKTNKKKFYVFFYQYMKALEIDNKKKPADTKKKGTTKDVKLDNFNTTEQVPLTTVNAILLKDLEKESLELDEFLTSLNSFNDIMKNKLNQHISSLEMLCSNYFNKDPFEDMNLTSSNFNDNNHNNKDKDNKKGKEKDNNNFALSEMEIKKKELNDVFNIWESYKLEGVKFAIKFASSNSNDTKYYEFCAKLMRRSIELLRANLIPLGNNGTAENVSALQDINSFMSSISVSDNDTFFINQIFNQKVSFQNYDIVYSMKLRIKSFMEKVSQQINITEFNSKVKVDNQSSGEDSQINSQHEQKDFNNDIQDINLEKIKNEIEDKYFKIEVTTEERVPYDSLDINEYHFIKEKFFWLGDLYLQMVNYEISEYLYSNIKQSSSAYNLLAQSGINSNINMSELYNYQNLNFNYNSLNLNYEINDFLSFRTHDYERFINLSREVTLLHEEIDKRKIAVEKEEMNSTATQMNITKTKATGKGSKENKKDNIKDSISNNNDSINKIINEELIIFLVNNNKISFLLENKYLFPSESYFSGAGASNFNLQVNSYKNINNDEKINDTIFGKVKEKHLFFIKNIIFDTKNKLEKISKIIENAARSSLFISEVKSIRSLDNLISTVTNLIRFDMLTPFEACKHNIWSYLLILMTQGILRLKLIKHGNSEANGKYDCLDNDLNSVKARLENKEILKDVINPNIPKNKNYGDNQFKKSELDNVKDKLSSKQIINNDIKHISVNNNTNTNNTTEMNQDNVIDSEHQIDYYKQNFNLDSYIELAFFVIKSLFHLKKYNILSYFITQFNSATNNKFADYSLPFLIDSQKNLHLQAKEHSTQKKQEINNRVKEFEIWKNSRKKNKRQQMITGEIPIEQIQFEKDYSLLNKELFVLESIENLLLTDLNKSKDLLISIENDANNAIKAFFACKKLLDRYKFELLNYKKLCEEKGVHHYEVINFKKSLTLFIDSVIENYKKAIVILKKRQENYYLILTIIDLSNICFSCGFEFREQYIKGLKDLDQEFNSIEHEERLTTDNISNTNNINNTKGLKSAKSSKMLMDNKKDKDLIRNAYRSEKDSFKYFDNAEMYYNEALDTIFQALYSLKEFRLIFNNEYNNNSMSNNQENKTIGEKYGIKELCLALIVLEKLSCYCYENNYHKQRECAIMSSYIAKHILAYSLPNPSYNNPFNYSSFKILNLNININCFNEDANFKPEFLVESIYKIVELLINYNLYEESLPLIAIGEHLCLDKIKNNLYLYRLRIKKIQSCSFLGFIKEAMIIFYKLIKRIDSIENFIFGNYSYIANSFMSVSNYGRFANIPKEILYDNSLTPDNPKNLECLGFFSKLVVDGELKSNLGSNLYSELLISRCQVYLKIFEKENVENYLNNSNEKEGNKGGKDKDKKDDDSLRQEYFTKIEKDMNEAIEILSISDEISILELLKFKLFLCDQEELGIEDFNYQNKIKEQFDIILSEEQGNNNDKNKGKKNDKSNTNNNTTVQLDLNQKIKISDWLMCYEILNEKLKQIMTERKISKDEVYKFYLNHMSTVSSFGSIINPINLKKERCNLLTKGRIILSNMYLSQNLYLLSSKVLLKNLEHLSRMSKNLYYDVNYDPLESYLTDFNLSLINSNKKDNKDNKTKQNDKNKNININSKNDNSICDITLINDCSQYIISFLTNMPNEDKKQNKLVFLKHENDVINNNINNQLSSYFANLNSNRTFFFGLKICDSGINFITCLYLLMRNYLKMKRFADVKTLIVEIEKFSFKLYDVYFSIRCREVMITLIINNYNFEEAKIAYFELQKLHKLTINDFKKLRAIKSGIYYKYIEQYQKEIITKEKEDEEEEEDFLGIKAEEKLKKEKENLTNEENLEADKSLNNSIIDIYNFDFLIFSLNFVEKLSSNNNLAIAINILIEIRRIFWLNLAEIGFYVDNNKSSLVEISKKLKYNNNNISKEEFSLFKNVIECNLNENAYYENILIDKQLKQMLIEKESFVMNQVGNKKDAKSGGKSQLSNNTNDLGIDLSQVLKNKDISNEINKIVSNKDISWINVKTENMIPFNSSVNDHLVSSSLYLKYTLSLIKCEILFVHLKLKSYSLMKKTNNNSTSINQKNPNQMDLYNKRNLELNSLYNILEDSSILLTKALYPCYMINVQLLYLKAQIKKQQFINAFNLFVKDRILTIKNLKVELLNRKNLIDISNYYSSELKTTWTPLLKSASSLLEKAVSYYKTESYLNYYEINCLSLVNSLIDIYSMLAELRPNMKPKFVDLFNIVDKIQSIYKKNIYYDKENDDLPDFFDKVVKPYIEELEKQKKEKEDQATISSNFENNKDKNKNKLKDDKKETKNKVAQNTKKTGDNSNDNNAILESNIKIIESLDDLNEETNNFIQQRNKKEILEQNNFLLLASYYIGIAVKLQEFDNSIKEKIQELNSQNLADPTKCPKDVISSILESDVLEKKRYKNLLIPTQQVAKQNVDISDVLETYKKLIKEYQTSTFDNSCLVYSANDDLKRNISKLFKYLKANSTLFSNKTDIDLNGVSLLTDVNVSPIKEGNVYIYWYSEDHINYNLNFLNDAMTNSNSNSNNSSFQETFFKLKEETSKTQSFKNNENSKLNTETRKTKPKISNMIYILGPQINSLNKTECLFGRVPFLEEKRKALNSRFFELKLKVKALKNETEVKRERDERYLEEDFKKIIKEFGLDFLNTVSFYLENKKASLAVHEELIPKVSIESVDKFIQCTALQSSLIIDESMNEFLSDLHCKILSPKIN